MTELLFLLEAKQRFYCVCSFIHKHLAEQQQQQRFSDQLFPLPRWINNGLVWHWAEAAPEFQSPEGKTLKPCLTLLDSITNDTCPPNPPALQTRGEEQKEIPRRSEELDLKLSVTVAPLSYADGCSPAPHNAFLFAHWYDKYGSSGLLFKHPIIEELLTITIITHWLHQIVWSPFMSWLTKSHIYQDIF